MYRTHTCGELRLADVGREVTLAGWVQRIRKMGGMSFIDVRDRYGITQAVTDDADMNAEVAKLGREFVVQIIGTVRERSNKNSKMDTGDVEVRIGKIIVLNPSAIPPFTIEDVSDGGDDLRMKYRYLDLRRNPLKNNLILRHRMAQEIRRYLDAHDFLEIETPFLIRSTPEGARDFVVPSRMNPGEFYALPQSPQQQKQLLMVAGFDRYFQIVKCFRDEDLRADRQPEFTQVDCEMSFVERDDVLEMFEGMMKYMFKVILDKDFNEPFLRMQWNDAMKYYGSDKPDMRFDMLINDLTDLLKGKGFGVFDSSEYVGGICVPGCASYSRKQLDELTDWVKRPQVGAKGLVYIKLEEDGSIKSSIDKFFSTEQLKEVADRFKANKGDLMLLMCGVRAKTLISLGTLRIEMGNRLNLRDSRKYCPLWVVDFPLLEWDDETQRFYATHHPFTAPSPKDMDKFFSNEKDQEALVSSDSYDFVLNGTEVGGGSIRIHDGKVQEQMFKVLGFTREEADYRFGFLINAFKYGAPPHGGLAFGMDRFCALFGGQDTIRDFIAFPKNNMGRDVMDDAPAKIDDSQMNELYLKSTYETPHKD